jgi:thymidine phosphorylase
MSINGLQGLQMSLANAGQGLSKTMVSVANKCAQIFTCCRGNGINQQNSFDYLRGERGESELHYTSMEIPPGQIMEMTDFLNTAGNAERGRAEWVKTAQAIQNDNHGETACCSESEGEESCCSQRSN